MPLDQGYFATILGEGIVVQAVMGVRVPIANPRSLIALLLLIKYKEGVVNKCYFNSSLERRFNSGPCKG